MAHSFQDGLKVELKEVVSNSRDMVMDMERVCVNTEALQWTARENHSGR